jgi:hypothetical protein
VVVDQPVVVIAEELQTLYDYEEKVEVHAELLLVQDYLVADQLHGEVEPLLL